MLKKLALWGMYSAFLGLLLAGAMYRTSVKLGDGGQNQNRGNQSRQGTSGRGGNQSVIESVTDNAQLGVYGTEVKEASILTSQVLDINNRGITLQLSDGQMTNVTGRAWRYAQALGFSTQVSDTLRLEGYYEGNRFEIVHMTNIETIQSVSLRDETGRPLWNGK